MLALLPIFLATALGTVQAQDQTYESGKFLFANTKTIDFATFDASGGDVHAFLQTNGLNATDWVKEDQPLKRGYKRDNVNIQNGALQMTVNPVDQANVVYGAEVEFIENKILYGSIITTAKSSNVEGICEGFFYYLDDQHEIDIEILTSYKTKGYGEANANPISPGIQLTNQPLVAGGPKTTQAFPTPTISDGNFHDYRIDWSPGRTAFFIDDQQVATFTDNVSDQPGSWLWNAWSNGDPGWSAGPPQANSITEISKITMYYNTTDASAPVARY